MSGRDVALTVLIGVALATGPPFWFQWIPGVGEPGPAQASGVIGFAGGCAPFTVHAQNRWLPYGAAIRSAPSPTAHQVAGKDPNQLIAVDGWVHAAVAYPYNTAPWNSDVWFHMSDGGGWVSFAGVRATQTDQDPAGRADGGPPAPTSSGCQGAAQ